MSAALKRRGIAFVRGFLARHTAKRALPSSYEELVRSAQAVCARRKHKATEEKSQRRIGG